MYGFEYLKKFLREEGFRVNEKEGSFSFKYNRMIYSVPKEENKYLVINMICSVNNVDRGKLLEVCNSLNRDKFVLKFTVDSDDDVWCGYEFIPSERTTPDDFEDVFQSLDMATDEMFARLKK